MQEWMLRNGWNFGGFVRRPVITCAVMLVLCGVGRTFSATSCRADTLNQLGFDGARQRKSSPAPAVQIRPSIPPGSDTGRRALSSSEIKKYVKKGMLRLSGNAKADEAAPRAQLRPVRSYSGGEIAARSFAPSRLPLASEVSPITEELPPAAATPAPAENLAEKVNLLGKSDPSPDAPALSMPLPTEKIESHQADVSQKPVLVPCNAGVSADKSSKNTVTTASRWKAPRDTACGDVTGSSALCGKAKAVRELLFRYGSAQAGSDGTLCPFSCAQPGEISVLTGVAFFMPDGYHFDMKKDGEDCHYRLERTEEASEWASLSITRGTCSCLPLGCLK